MTDQLNLKGWYEKGEMMREPAVRRAERAAKVTIPSVFPPDGHTESTELPAPYQGLGARAVNTLASKIVMALLPPNTAFFRMGFDSLTRAQMDDSQDVDHSQASKNLSELEQVIVNELEQTSIRAVCHEAFRHKLVTGNFTIGCSNEGRFTGYTLRSYCVWRDHEGNVTRWVGKQQISWAALPEDLRNQVEQPHDAMTGEDNVDLYTCMLRKDNKWSIWQEVEDVTVPGTDFTAPLDAPPFIVMRLSAVPGEHYGRGLVDDYYGDFSSLDDLSRDLLDMSAACARTLGFLDPNSPLTPKKVAEAKNLDILLGRAEDLGFANVGKIADLRHTQEQVNILRSSIAEAFLMTSTIQRDAERVTAEEIRVMAAELEDGLGGLYSMLAREFQAPLVRRFAAVLGRKKLIPKLPESELRIQVTTGIDALGRGHELRKMASALEFAFSILGDQMRTRLKDDALINRIAAGHGTDLSGLLLTDDQVQTRMQQQSLQRAAESALPGVAQEAMKNPPQENS